MPYPVLAGRTAMYEAERARCANGKLELLSGANQILATFTLDATAGSVAASGQDVVWTLGFVAASVNGSAAAGVGTTAAKARIRTSGNADEIVEISVSPPSGSGDIKLINTSISEDQAVTISSATITWPNPGA